MIAEREAATRVRQEERQRQRHAERELPSTGWLPPGLAQEVLDMLIPDEREN
jgi:hypothetical protein